MAQSIDQVENPSLYNSRLIWRHELLIPELKYRHGFPRNLVQSLCIRYYQKRSMA